MRVIMTSSYSFWGELDPKALWAPATNKQIGGGETAMLHSARGWAEQGHEVLLCCNTKPGKAFGIDFVPDRLYVDLVTNVDADVLVAWDAPHAFRYADRANVHILAYQLNHTDVATGIFNHMIDQYWHPSKWHIDRFLHEYRFIPSYKCHPYMTNGVDLERYLKLAEHTTYAPHRVVYTSSPDRGLHHLLRFWPRVMDAVPDAELHVYYDIQKWLDMDTQLRTVGLPNITRDRVDLIAPAFQDPAPGVTFHGGVGQYELAKAQVESALLCYPCDPVAPTEGFSMTILEGLTAGCQVVTTNADAFEELWSGTEGVTMLPLPIQDDVWVDTIVKLLLDDKQRRIREVLEHQWAGVVTRQIQEVTRCLRTH